jgi:hypothetical protein
VLKAIIAGLTLCFSLHSWSQIVVVHIRGDVVAGLDDKKLTPVKNGAIISDKSLVKVLPKSLAILKYPSGSRVKLGPNSSLLLSLKKDSELAQLRSGSAFFQIVKKKLINSKPSFEVGAAKASFAVRGTEFFVSYGKSKTNDIWMCVNEGLVEAKSGKGQAVLVSEGQEVKVDTSDGVSAPKPLPWTKSLNWNMEPDKGELDSGIDISEAYTDFIQKDYD